MKQTRKMCKAIVRFDAIMKEDRNQQGIKGGNSCSNGIIAGEME